MISKVNVIGAGLAGCEVVWQLRDLPLPVNLYEMKPHCHTPAHHENYFAELVCSNSLRSDSLSNGVGLLKAEMRSEDSLIMQVADETRVPAGSALAVDRHAFGNRITELIYRIPNLTVITSRINDIAEVYSEDSLTVVATGPLTESELYQSILTMLGSSSLFFFDSAAPIVYADSIDFDQVFAQSRYNKGTADYLNCPLDREQYLAFREQLLAADCAKVKDFDRNALFSGCMPIEELARQSEDTMRYGPLKPVGLIDPRTGQEPYACIQLRRENVAGELYNLVGFQTRLSFPEQRRVFRCIPGLANAVFARYGVMHRNTFLNSPQVLQANYCSAQYPRLYFAGQITGVEGYIESAASGLVVGKAIVANCETNTDPIYPVTTMLGALSDYVCRPNRDFQPMNANFGLLPALSAEDKKRWRNRFNLRERGRRAKRLLYAARSINDFPTTEAKKTDLFKLLEQEINQ